MVESVMKTGAKVIPFTRMRQVMPSFGRNTEMIS